MDIKPLRYFIALAETQHFGQASKRLHISQPPLSRQIAALEQDLGVKLFERNSRHVRLTTAGACFYIDACNILNHMEQAIRNVRSIAAGETGQLTIGFTMCAAYSVVPRYAKAFKAQYPNVTLHLREIVSHDLAENVANGTIDAAIMLSGAPDIGLSIQTIVAEPLCVALSIHHPLADLTQLEIQQLTTESFIVASEDAAPSLYTTIMDLCQSHGFQPNIRYKVQLQQTILSLVNEEAGIALVPASMQKAQLQGVIFRPLIRSPMVEQVLAWSPTNHNPCLEKFIKCINNEIS